MSHLAPEGPAPTVTWAVGPGRRRGSSSATHRPKANIVVNDDLRPAAGPTYHAGNCDAWPRACGSDRETAQSASLRRLCGRSHSVPEEKDLAGSWRGSTGIILMMRVAVDSVWVLTLLCGAGLGCGSSAGGSQGDAAQLLDVPTSSGGSGGMGGTGDAAKGDTGGADASVRDSFGDVADVAIIGNFDLEFLAIYC